MRRKKEGKPRIIPLMRKAKVLVFENLNEENISRRREQSTMLTDIDRTNI